MRQPTPKRFVIRLSGLFYIAPESMAFTDSPLRRAIMASSPGDYVSTGGLIFGRRCDRALVLNEKEAMRFQSRNSVGATAELF